MKKNRFLKEKNISKKTLNNIRGGTSGNVGAGSRIEIRGQAAN